jgi:hypothetical protein
MQLGLQLVEHSGEPPDLIGTHQTPLYNKTVNLVTIGNEYSKYKDIMLKYMLKKNEWNYSNFRE